jgi:HSP20 family molecular chaperone IbpA
MFNPFFGFGGLLDRFDSVGPHCHVRETPTSAILEVEVPRYTPEEIKVASDPTYGTVNISAQRANQNEDDDMLLFSASPLTRFSRTFTFSPYYYDVSKFTTSLAYGVLTVTVPKLERRAIEANQQQQQQQPEAVTVFGGNNKGELVAKTSPEEFEALTRARWPPVVKREENATALTYKCELPPTVTKDHITLQLHGRHLDLSVNYDRHTKSKHSEESHSVTYSTTFTVPQGTQPNDIHTTYENGLLVVTLDKPQQQQQQAKQAIPVDPKPASKA